MEPRPTLAAALPDEEDPEHPRQLIPALLRQFYQLHWVMGTGGSVSIRLKDHIYIGPSGMQKERVRPEDLFVMNMDGENVSVPSNSALRRSSVAPIFLLGYKLRQAGAAVHTHPKSAVLATLLWTGAEFRCTHQHMMKGVFNHTLGRNLHHDETLVVPIIENTNQEADLGPEMERALNQYPGTPAVLVRRHGLYVWGASWQQAKVMTECLDFVFQVAVEMRRLGLDPEKPPESAKSEA